MTEAIVVGLDRSRSSLQALEWAAREAALHRCPLRIVHALPRYRYDMPFLPPGWWEAFEADGKELLTDAAGRVREDYPSLETSIHLPSEHAVVALREEAERARAVVVGSRGYGGFHNLLLGSTSLQLVGHAASPVVVVRDGSNGLYREIVVGVDGSEYSVAALGYAFEEAAARRSRLRALHIWRPPVDRARPTASEPERLAEEGRRVLTHALTGWQEKHPSIEVNPELAREHPAHALIRASEHADLVVVGSRGRGGFHGLALGSVSHAVAHHATCPVVVARPRP